MLISISPYLISSKEEFNLPLNKLNSKSPLERFENGWTYASKSFIATRHFLNASIRSCRWFALGCRNMDQRVMSIVTKLKLFSIVSVPLNLHVLPAKIKELWKNLKRHDAQGVILGTLSITLITTDVIDSLATFTNAALQTLSFSAIGLLSDASLPLAFTLIGVGSISRIIRLFYLKKLQTALRDQAITEFLNERLGSINSPDRAKNESTLERQANGQILTLIKELEKDQGSQAVILKQVMILLNKEIRLQILTLFANSMNFAGICLFLTPASPAVSFLLLGMGFSMRLGIQAYQDFAA